MFRAINLPILRSTFFNCLYSFWHNAPTLLPTGATVEMESVPRLKWNCFISILAPVGSSDGALYQKLYTQLKGAPEDGRIYRPKHVGLISKD